MNCELAHERIVMAAYGELPDDAAHELDRHLVTCVGCRGEREQMQALKLLAEAYPVAEPSAKKYTPQRRSRKARSASSIFCSRSLARTQPRSRRSSS